MIRNDDETYFDERDFKELLERYEMMVKEHKSSYFDPDELADIADYYMSEGEEEKAHQCVEYGEYLYPDNSDLKLFRVRLLLFDGHVEEAKLLRKKVIDSQADIHDLIFVDAEILLREGKNAEALAHFEKHRHDEEDENYVSDVASVLLDFHVEGCKPWIEEAIRLAPNDFKAKQLLADYYVRGGQYEEARDYLDKLLEDYPYSWVCWGLYADALFNLDCFDESIEACDFALAINEESFDALMIKANCYFHLDRYEDAHIIYQKCIALRPDNDLCYLYDGVALMSVGRQQESYELLKRAEQISEGKSLQQQQIYIQLACVTSRLGHLDEALEYISKAGTCSEGLDDSWRLYMRGCVYLEVGDKYEALQNFYQALEADPSLHDELVRCASNAIFDARHYALYLAWLDGNPFEDEHYTRQSYIYRSYCHLQLAQLKDAGTNYLLAKEYAPESVKRFFNICKITDAQYEELLK